MNIDTLESATQIEITGATQDECDCLYCGRPLRVGVLVAGYGQIGSDCLNKLIVADRKRFSITGKPGAEYVRKLARIRNESEARQKDMGFYPHQFRFQISKPLTYTDAA
jgi:hypothetical protein